MTKEILLQKMKEAKERIISKMKPGQTAYIRISSIAVKGEKFFLDGNDDYDLTGGGCYDKEVKRTDNGFQLVFNTLDESDIEYLAKHGESSFGDLPVEIV